MDKIGTLICDYLKPHAIRLADVQHHCPLSAFGTLYRLQQMERDGIVIRDADDHRVTMYRLATKEEKEKEGTPWQAPPKSHGSDAEIENESPQ
jgi:hypothetical protein